MDIYLDICKCLVIKNGCGTNNFIFQSHVSFFFLLLIFIYLQYFFRLYLGIIYSKLELKEHKPKKKLNGNREKQRFLTKTGYSFLFCFFPAFDSHGVPPFGSD